MVIAPGESSTDLVSAAIAGDEVAFDALVGPHIETGFRLAAVMLRDGEEARDAVQEACFTAWRKLSQLRNQAQLRPWFLTIVANQCRDVRRTRWWSIVRLAEVREDQEASRSDVEQPTSRFGDVVVHTIKSWTRHNFPRRSD